MSLPLKATIDPTYLDVVNESTIDTSSLKIGMTIKNYKQLCELLNQEVEFGNSKKSQLLEFERYFDWEKIGQKFIITDVYDTPLDKEDKRKFGNNSIYVKYIEVILLQYLSSQTGYKRSLSKRNWWELLGIVNHKYGKLSKKQLEKTTPNATSWEIQHFYQRCDKKLEQILFSSLRSLQSRKLITYKKQRMIVTDNETFEATDKQEEQILKVERYVLKVIMGYDKIFEVFLRLKQKEFYDNVNTILKSQYGWNYTFKQIKIIYTADGVREALPEMKLKLQKELLNAKVINSINTNAQYVYDKNKAKYLESLHSTTNVVGFGLPDDTLSKNKVWCPPDHYVETQNILTNELIKIGHSDLNFSVDNFIESNDEYDFYFDE